MSKYGLIRKIVLLVVCGVLLAAVVTAAVCVIYVGTAEVDKNENPTEFFSQWMSFVDKDTLVKDIVVPGSHDAGTFTMNWLGKTQNLDIKTQLEYGTRYFDLRIEKHNGELYIFHSVIRGDKARPMLQEIRDFIEQNTSETIILDFQHFKGEGSSTATVAMLKEIFYTDSTTKSNLLVKNTARNSSSNQVTDSQFLNNLKLGDYKPKTVDAPRGKCIVFWGSGENLDNNFLFVRNNDGGTRPNSSLHSFYDGSYNKMSSKDYIKLGLPKYISQFKTLNSDTANYPFGGGFFVLQGQLTDGLYVFGPEFRERQHNQNMNQYVANLTNTDNLKHISVVMRDFVNGTKNSLAIALNLDKSSVKLTDKAAFADGLKHFVDVTYEVSETD